MKKAMIMAVALFMAPMVFGQTASDQLFEKYSGKDGYTSIHITQYMFQLFADLDTDEEMKEFTEMASSIDRMKILTVDSDSLNPRRAQDFFKDATNTLPIKQYQELMVVKDGEQTVQMLIQEEGKMVSEFLMLVNDDHETVVISITGNIDLNQLARMSSKMNIDGLENLQELEDRDDED